jgi:hypothetical protein
VTFISSDPFQGLSKGPQHNFIEVGWCVDLTYKPCHLGLNYDGSKGVLGANAHFICVSFQDRTLSTSSDYYLMRSLFNIAGMQ